MNDSIIVFVCHISSMGRVFDFRAHGPRFLVWPDKVYKLCSVDYNVHIK